MRGGLWVAVVGVLGLGAFAPGAAADPVAMGGAPLTVYTGALGQCQSAYADTGGNYFPGDSTSGDCGFFLATPSAPAGQPSELQGQVFGFNGQAGPSGVVSYTPVSQGAVTGSGTSADPFEQVTVYDADGPQSADTLLQVTETTTYVSGSTYFTSYFDVRNMTDRLAPDDQNANSTIYFRAMYAADVFVGGDDHGVGVFKSAPVRFVGGQNTSSGMIGGFFEQTHYLDGSRTPGWSSYAEDYWKTPGIWDDVENAADAPQAFADTISSTWFDNGAGVAWDQYYTSGLRPGADARFAIVNSDALPVTSPAPPPSLTPPSALPPPSRPCAAVRGGIGKRLLHALKCTAAMTAAEVKCGVSVAMIVLPFTKAVKGLKTARGLYDLRKVRKDLRPLAKLYNDLMTVKFGRNAPRGFRTGAQVIDKLKAAHTGWAVVRIVPSLAKALSARNYERIAVDIADLAGLDACVHGLELAVE